MDTEDEKKRLRSVAIKDPGGARLASRREDPKSIVAKKSRSTSQMRNFAELLIAYESREDDFSGTIIPAAFPVCEKLRPHLANLMGATGFRALLARALTRAEAEHPSLRAMQVKEDGILAGLDKLETQTDPQEHAAGGVVLVAQLLDLLVAFIGEKLTLQIICGVWPKLPLDDLSLFQKETK